MAMRRSGPNEPIRCRPAARSELHRQEIAEQRAVGDIDGEGSAQHIGAPRRIVAFQHLRRAGVFARRHRLAARCRRYRRRRAAPCSGPARRSAGSHARPRRPARRDAFANCLGCSIASGNRWRPGSTRRRPRIECDWLSAASDNSSSDQRHQPLGLLRRRDPYDAGAIAGQRHKYAWALRGMKLRRDISMRPRMADVEGQRRLIEFAAP